MLKMELGKALVKVLRKEAKVTKVKILFKYVDPIVVEFKASKKGIYAVIKQRSKVVDSYSLYTIEDNNYVPLNFSKQYEGVKTNALDYIMTKVAMIACYSLCFTGNNETIKLI